MKLPAIPSVTNVQGEEGRALAAIKEIIEVREGRRPNGDKLDCLVTLRDLVALGLITEAQARAL